ncbi:hypothetical protein BHM03_00008428 [Ensete ventricosum]|nr:hypothetical protein BHM03_00008428 [Ensete ventricosum]
MEHKKGTRGGQWTASCTPFAATVSCFLLTVAMQSLCPSLYSGLMMNSSSRDCDEREREPETSATSVPGYPPRLVRCPRFPTPLFWSEFSRWRRYTKESAATAFPSFYGPM